MVIKLNTTSIHHLFAENQNQNKKKKKKREAYSELNFSFKAQKYHIH